MMLNDQGADHKDPTRTGDFGYEPPERKKGASQLVVGLAGLFLLAALGFAAFVIIGGSDPVNIGPMEQGVAAEAETATIEAEPEITTTTAPSTTVDSSADNSSADNSSNGAEEQILTTTSILATTAVTAAVEGTLSDGRIELSGTVPSADVSQSYVTLFETFVGAGNVTGEFTVTEDAPLPGAFRLQVTDSVLFEPGGETVQDEFLPLLDQVASFMTTDPNITLIVEGHTDSDGDPVVNLALSQRRADAVKEYLEGEGINAFRLEAQGRGDTEPVGDNATQEGRQSNRRIEFLMVGFRPGDQ